MEAMTGGRAIEQMEFLHHDFLWVSNAETQWANVVYRRRNGGYGLIEREV
jgi:putative sigma-54 modulation protein